MSWTDKASIEHIKKIRDKFKVKTFVETGTHVGINVLTHLDNFNYVFSCEKDEKYFNIANDKIIEYYNKNNTGIPAIFNDDSKKFLKWFRELYDIDKKTKDSIFGDYIIFYLDANFYDKKRPKGKGKFVVLDELKAIKGFDKAIIIIHDFDNNLGHITYDGVSLDMNLVKKDLLKVNPKFKFYTNELSSCDIMKIEETDDKDMKENLVYAWSKPDKTYRGILYCVPKKINIEGLREYG